MSDPAYECDGRPVSPAAFYALACDPRRSVAVEACAGAGKTWMLVSRILRALLEDGPRGVRVQPQDILAITFTKKAAGEMRQRLTQWLAQYAAATPAELQAALADRGVPADRIAALAPRLQTLYADVLAQGRPVQIRTFHSWFAALLRTAPLAVLQRLDLPAQYELLEDDTEAVSLVWRPFQAAVVADPVLHADYLASVALHGRSQTAKALTAALAKRVEFRLADADGVAESSVQAFQARYPALAACATPPDALGCDTARQRWLGWARALGEEKNKTPQKAAQAIVDAWAMPSLQARLEALRKALFVAAEDRLTQHLQKFDAAREAEAELALLCAAARQHAAWEHQGRMVRLGRCLLSQFAALKRARGWVDMNDVECAAQQLLADPVLSGWVQERLDARVAHLLIDEFQDTNPLQWQALHAWLSGYAGAGGDAPSVFLVGDPKQSIYRFRRAEPQVFKAAQAFVRQGLGGHLLSCDHTRRNAPPVTQAVNAVMLQAQSGGEYDSFRTHTTDARGDGAVWQLPPIPRPPRGDKGEDAGPESAGWRDSLSTPRVVPEETLRTLECRQAARWLAAQVAQGLAPGEVMVLARKRDRLVAMQQELRTLGLPAVLAAKDDLAEAPEVQDLLALLDVLVSTGHDLSLAQALKSPLFGLSDAALAQLAARVRQHGGSWWDATGQLALQNPEQTTPDWQGLQAQLLRWKAWLDSLPPHDALDAIYHDAQVLQKFAAAAPAPLRGRVMANLRALLGAALQVEGARYVTPYRFVRALRAGGVRAPATADAGAMRLLTVHGAKGLEAGLVLLLDTDAAAAKAETMGVLVDWPGEAAAPRRFVFLASESRPPACAEDAVAIEQAARQREELNALYVAMTRAQTRLVVSAVVATGQGAQASWWARLGPLAAPAAMPVAPGQPDPERVGEAAGAGEAVSGPVPLPAEQFWMPNMPFVQSGRALVAIQTIANDVPMEAAELLASRLGQAMHRLLEWTPPGAPPFQPAQLAAVAREFDLTAAQAAQAAARARAILDGEGAWAWQADALLWHGNEVALQHNGQLLRLDRLVQRKTDGGPGVWWVLDYKLASDPARQPELQAQLRQYAAAVRAVYPGEPVVAALLGGDGRQVCVD